MTHEFIDIVNQTILAKKQGLKSVLASVVSLDGSSYRRPGVRMLINEDGSMTGAVSGGCVEKEVLRQAASVFETGKSKIMTYDGRYRLGCEGVLYILIEPIQFSDAFLESFFYCINDRKPFEIVSCYDKKEGFFEGIGSSIKFKNGKEFFISKESRSHLNSNEQQLLLFKQIMPPRFKLIIIGAEHDAVQLCRYGALTGWEINIVSGLSESKSLKNFPGAKEFHAISPEELDISKIDNQTAIVLMTHSFATDLRYLVALKEANPVYIGLLGPTRRREDLLNQLVNYCPDISDAFLEVIHGPAGINIGAETPQEIAVSIVSEILSVVRNEEPIFLSKKVGRIHAKD